MAIVFAGQTFEGPYDYMSDLKVEAGVFVVTGQRADGSWFPIDVDESDAVRMSVNRHDRQQCWRDNAKAAIRGYAVRYLPGSSADERRALAAAIRHQCGPLPCGNP